MVQVLLVPEVQDAPGLVPAATVTEPLAALAPVTVTVGTKVAATESVAVGKVIEQAVESPPLQATIVPPLVPVSVHVP